MGDGKMFNRRNPLPKDRRTNPDFEEVARILRSLADPYRPELHYMRGPGPKWHAKHRSAAPEAPAFPGLARFKG
jgi:hypothetical protein